MSREPALMVLAVTLLVVTAGAVVAAPGALDDPREPDEDETPPGSVDVAEMAIEPGEVTGETAELRLLAGLEHRRGPVENVTVRYRATDADSGLLVDERRVDVGDVERDGEFVVNGSLVVEREGSYEVETTVFVDDERVSETTSRVDGVAALTPAYADQRVGFTESAVWPTVTVSVDEADDDTATLRVAASVTNRGDDPSDDLRLGVVLRQADSNVVADGAETTVESVRPGRTDTVEVTVTVPAEYNYYVDAALWQDDVLVDEHGSVANLDPEETISANETTQDVGFEVEDFAEDEPAEAADAPAETRDAERSADDAPGFGVLLAVVAVLAVAAAARVAGRDR